MAILSFLNQKVILIFSQPLKTAFKKKAKIIFGINLKRNLIKKVNLYRYNTKTWKKD